ncbi:TetR family transcriptional regulator [Phyllobacterium myrsinacearum]|uniref:TetR family transcriptional regulator n=1 Tax=Phyllobacterium myrsinacearum TaxID=28101 RepID=A0A2S9JAL6_9HYPH|nr:TetR family transcriptional regulator [Phyllobacterium myrsinacearum]PWV83958.1 TetR family transcriptional regulator [Phyllobacterium myrsinacearum]RZS76804.1 TetR family transcriptional regulator [Phyllobacterium myrsinacearum]RZU96976.1 TetR family transcriptional regulator [Phyllobacterium myrsinacearum]
MISSPPQALKPRKRPQQRRALATLDAIFEATIQLLVKDGLSQLTTTRVAERAGVSVGTMYQYFPHKQALIYAVNERYLELLAERIEATCRDRQGSLTGDMVEALIDTYWQAKTDKPDVTRALYRSVVEMDNEALISAFAVRTDVAITAMLASASDNDRSDARSNTRTLVTVIFGTVRNSFERGHSGEIAEDLRRQLVIMCRAYLERL